MVFTAEEEVGVEKSPERSRSRESRCDHHAGVRADFQKGRQKQPGARQNGLANQEQELGFYSQHSRTPRRILESDGI